MKPFLPLCIFLVLLVCSGCENAYEQKTASGIKEAPVAKTDSSRLLKAFIMNCGQLEIIPVDESGKASSLLRFIDRLKKAVAKKDTALLFELMAPDIVSSHGGLVIGKKDFIQNWELQKNPSASEVWPKLERAIALGGCFDQGMNAPAFVMPYLQASHHFGNGCSFDWYNTYVCLSPATKIYGKPDKTSRVVAELKYRILESSPDAKQVGSFIPVNTVDGQVQGYVHEQDVYLCADHMLVIDRSGENWIIQEFVPFD